ncbi:MAG TPA: cell wall-binding repeat-containing protein [Acidothermaceae bacterium]
MTELWRGRYRPVDVVAQGGQGRLLRAIDRQHDRPVALKVRRVGSVEQRNQVLAEARVLLALRPHPSLPTVREDFFEGDHYVLVMDWVEGTSLDQVVATRGAPGMPLPSVLRWAEQLAAAIDHLHAHRPVIVHGDVKPANVVLTPDDRVVLVDFGIASSGLMVSAGTAGYTAPEVLDGEPPTPAADVYGLAAAMLALLTGRPPGEIRPPWDGVDPTAVQVIERALRPGLSLEPQRRPASAGELVERMRSWSGAAASAPAPPGVQPSRRSRRRVGPARLRRWIGAAPAWLRAGAVVVLVGVVVATLALGGGARSPVLRLQGPDRYTTAAAIATASFSHTDVAVLARGDDLSDAVAASYLAGAQGGGPLLLTPPDKVPDAVLEALRRLKVKQVYIVGDASAIGAGVDAALRQRGMRTARLAGVNRYATAAVIEQAGGQPATLAGLGATALVVNPNDLADAVLAGSVAYRGRFPLLYADADKLPAETLSALAEDDIKHVVVIGSSSQVGDGVAASLARAGMSVERVSGQGDPASESVAVAKFARDKLRWSAPQLDLARGDQGGVDGVAAVANVGARGGALLLTNGPNQLDPPLLEYLKQQKDRHDPPRRLIVVGDRTTVTPAVEAAAAKALGLAG